MNSATHKPNALLKLHPSLSASPFNDDVYYNLDLNNPPELGPPFSLMQL
jgi:hypothetical protein